MGGDGAGPTEWPALATLEAVVLEAGATTRAGLAIRLERQVGKPRRGGPAYEERVDREGRLPTREASWHDFFNALAWAAFPAAKRALSGRLAQALDRSRAAKAARRPHARTREQDALALLDEGSVLFGCAPVAAAAATAAVAVGDGAALTALVESGVACGAIFGHALYEHLAQGATDRLRATIVVLPLPGVWAEQPAAGCNERPSALDERRSALDQAFAQALEAPRSFAQPAPTLAWHEGLARPGR
jgi:hypothetical protein